MGKIVFLHPDLGVGGAERAVIDAALALKSRGHTVEFVTAHHDATHCFPETKDGTLRVTTVGDWLPRHIFGQFYAFFAYCRMICAAIYLVAISSIQYDLIFCDQISACIPFLKLFSAKVLFYCHFPDMLLTQRTNWLKRIYRIPLDYIEEITTGMADCVLVNSKFTAQIFHQTFKSLRHIQPEVLYPVPGFSSFDGSIQPPSEKLMPHNVKTVLLSINRYERKKNLNLAITAFGELQKDVPDADTHLIMSGGYDDRVSENVEHYAELNSLVESLGLQDKVTFLRSISDSQKQTLLKYSTCLVYTPSNEHFGIVPIESMYMKCPVIAMNNGGPMETVVDGVTGFLCKDNATDVAAAMKKLITDSKLADTFGEAGKQRVQTEFSFVKYTEKLDAIVTGILTGH